MNTFLLVIALAVLFVLGPVLAMRPSPRQAQLARLRARAIATGLRVRVTGSGTRGLSTDYLLPWRVAEAPEVRGAHLAARREAPGDWECTDCGVLPEASFRALLARFPGGIVALRCCDEGLAAEWDEKGRDDDVDRIAALLQEVREALSADRRAAVERQ